MDDVAERVFDILGEEKRKARFGIMIFQIKIEQFILGSALEFDHLLRRVVRLRAAINTFPALTACPSTIEFTTEKIEKRFWKKVTVTGKYY